MLKLGIRKQPPQTSGHDNQIYALQAVECAGSYRQARAAGRAFAYSGGNTFLNGGGINDSKGAGMIDCSTYIYLVLCGVPYGGSPYCSDRLRLERRYPWGDTALLKDCAGHGRYRYAADLARYFFRRHRCFTDPACVQPGDLTFHSARPNSRFMSITHVGMVAEDTEYFYNVTDLSDTVVRSRLSSRKDIVFFVRPDYQAQIA